MATPSGIQKIIAWVLRLRLVRAFLTYSDHRGSMLADSVTYRALFSIFAGVLLGFSLAALWLGGNPDALRALWDSLDSVVPGLTDVIDPESIDAPTGFTITGAISFIGLIAAAIGAITSLRTALRELGDVLHDDGFIVWVYVRNLLVAVGFAGLLAAAAVLSAAGSVGIVTVAGWVGISITSLAVQIVSQVVSVLVVFIVDAIAIAFVFRVLSGIRAPRRALWGGALIGAVGLTVLQTLSGLFVSGATSNPLLATFAVLIALLIWVNLSIQVVLIASSYIIVATAESHDRIREKYGAQTFAERRVKRAEDLLAVATQELREAQEAARPTPADEADMAVTGPSARKAPRDR